MSFRIVPAGDGALVLELEEAIDLEVNRKAVVLAGAIRTANFAGVTDVVPTFRSVAVYFDPVETNVAPLRSLLEQAAESAHADPGQGNEYVIPVEYGGAAGPDLADVATAAGLSEDEVIARHADVSYRVFMLGFLPGFAYMGALDASLTRPRRATPRSRVPAGSVAIAGALTGIYPMESPGGWHLIGRTTATLFDIAKNPPARFKAGDTVRFTIA
jgi:KipI family sensor histidine kinase inhibitor